MPEAICFSRRGGVGGDEAGDQVNTGAGDTLVSYSLEPDEYLSLGALLVPRMIMYDDPVRYNKECRHVDALAYLRRIVAQCMAYHPSDRPSLQELLVACEVSSAITDQLMGMGDEEAFHQAFGEFLRGKDPNDMLYEFKNAPPSQGSNLIPGYGSSHGDNDDQDEASGQDVFDDGFGGIAGVRGRWRR